MTLEQNRWPAKVWVSHRTVNLVFDSDRTHNVYRKSQEIPSRRQYPPWCLVHLRKKLRGCTPCAFLAKYSCLVILHRSKRNMRAMMTVFRRKSWMKNSASLCFTVEISTIGHISRETVVCISAFDTRREIVVLESVRAMRLHDITNIITNVIRVQMRKWFLDEPTWVIYIHSAHVKRIRSVMDSNSTDYL